MKKRTFLLIIILIASALVLTSCGSAVTGLRVAGDLSKTAYIIGDTCVVINDGSEEKHVYTAGFGYCVKQTQWSPDGRNVSFYQMGGEDTSDLLLYDTVTGNVTDTGVNGHGAGSLGLFPYDVWSSDSSKVIVYGNEGGGYYDIAAAKLAKIGSTSSDFMVASFSPDGSKILYGNGGMSQDGNKMMVYDIAAGASTVAYEFTGSSDPFNIPPQWISNTEFLVSNEMDATVHRINLTTGKASEYATHADWGVLSPDKKHFAYLRYGQELVVPCIKNLSTGEEIEIKADNSIVGTPVWSSDSQKVLLCTDTSIAVFGLDGQQIGQTIQCNFDHSRLSIPVYTKDGLWYEGKETSTAERDGQL